MPQLENRKGLTVIGGSLEVSRIDSLSLDGIEVTKELFFFYEKKILTKNPKSLTAKQGVSPSGAWFWIQVKASGEFLAENYH